MTLRKCLDWGVLVAVFLGVAVAAAPAGEAPPASEKQGAAIKLTDYDDYHQAPIRNADLVKLMEEAELIVGVKFAPKDAAGGKWTAPWFEQGSELVRTCFKGRPAGKEIAIEGDPKAFENPCESHVSTKTFKALDFHLVFLKKSGGEGIYRCLDANPGGFRFYHAAGPSDERLLMVGRVNGRLVVEGLPARWGRATGPTTMYDALQGLASGAKLTASAAGGGVVVLELQPGRAGEGGEVLRELPLRAPVLWAEVERPEDDGVLLSREDYLPVTAASPYGKAGGGPVAGRVELFTGPVPEGGALTGARSNYRKPLLGSLPAGEHTVRFLCHVSDKELVISNPVKVQGKAGGATPADLDKLKAPAAFVDQPVTPPVKPTGGLNKADLKGEIWFESNREGNWDIFVMNADGSNVRNLTNTKDKDEFYPMPSPDGKQVAYVTGKMAGWSVWARMGETGLTGRQVWIMDREGKNAKKIADDACRPDWGPDGKALVYNCQVDKAKIVPCVQNIETGKVTQPLKKAEAWLRWNFAPRIAFSPTTRRLVMDGKLWTSAGAALMVVELDENYEFKGIKQSMTEYHGCTPQWSASGERLYFAHHDPAYGGTIVLWSMKVDGTDARRFETPTTKRWDGYGLVCESPDGTMVTYSPYGDIMVQRIADGAEVSLTGKGGKAFAPRWHKGPQ